MKENLKNGLYSSREGSCNIESTWIRAFRTSKEGPPIVPAWVQRDWMTSTQQGFANQRLPLRIANQSGWFILSNSRFGFGLGRWSRTQCDNDYL